MRIPFEQLHLSAQLGAGSQGAIFRVLGGQDRGFAFPLIYKEFSANTAVSGASLEVLANFRSSLTDGDRRVLDLRTVWPCAVVVKGPRVAGYVMQCIPDSFMQTIQTMTGSEPIPREVQHLFVADAIARKNLGEVPKRTERLALARQTAFVLGFLHKRDFVFGDFSYKNAVYTFRPRPMVMLLDCDAVRLRGQGAAVPQLNSPGWGAPEKGPQTIESDRYKLGLFILRCLTPGINAQNRNPDKAVNALDGEGLALLRRSLSADPQERASGKEWVTYLDARIEAAGGVRPRTQGAAAPAAPPSVGRAPAPRPPAPVAALAAVGSGPRRTPTRPFGVNLPGRAPAPVLPTSVVRVPRPRPFGRPRGAPAVPPGTGWVHPHQVQTGHLRAATGAMAWSPGTSASSAPTRLRLTGLQIAMGVLWAVVVIFFVIALLVSSGNNATSTRTNGSTSGFASPPAPVIADRAGVAVERVLAQAGPDAVLVRLSSEARRALVGSNTAPEAPDVWTVSVVDPSKIIAGQPAPVRRYDVVGEAVGPVVEAPMRLGARDGDASAPVVMPTNWQNSLANAIATFRLGRPFDLPTAVRFDCSPSATSPADCAWVFSQVGPGGAVPPEFVRADGTAVMTKPGWAGG